MVKDIKVITRIIQIKADKDDIWIKITNDQVNRPPETETSDYLRLGWCEIIQNQGD